MSTPIAGGQKTLIKVGERKESWRGLLFSSSLASFAEFTVFPTKVVQKCKNPNSAHVGSGYAT